MPCILFYLQLDAETSVLAHYSLRIKTAIFKNRFHSMSM